MQAIRLNSKLFAISQTKFLYNFITAYVICRLTKLKIFRMKVEMFLIYGCNSWYLTLPLENALDGTYTRILWKILWCNHMTNQELYGSLPWITTIVRQLRLRLTGHMMRHDEVANKVLLWKPDCPRRRGRPTTLRDIIEKDTRLAGQTY